MCGRVEMEVRVEGMRFGGTWVDGRELVVGFGRAIADICSALLSADFVALGLRRLRIQF